MENIPHVELAKNSLEVAKGIWTLKNQNPHNGLKLNTPPTLGPEILHRIVLLRIPELN
jgi:hypothetical protein